MEQIGEGMTIYYWSLGDADGYDPDGLLSEAEREELLDAWQDLSEQCLMEWYPEAEIIVARQQGQGLSRAEKTQVYEGDEPWDDARIAQLDDDIDSYVTSRIVEAAGLS